MRWEWAMPIRIDQQFFGCVLAPASGNDPLLPELMDLVATEISGFATEQLHRDRRNQEYRSTHSYHGIIGKSPVMQALYRIVDKVIASDSTVLVQGENGTGKELVARAIHFNSARAHHPFVVQNCSAFNDNLLDSELFGHKKGAFTGAFSDKQGLFELADKGSFFLDEIGDMSPTLQVKVLRVLQEGTFTPVGDTQSRHVDVRIIAATNRDLKTMVERGEFREDLYYRVHVISVTVPPLRDRREDIVPLVDYFLERNAKGRRLKTKVLSEVCLGRLQEYSWPGNIRELENEIERLVVLAGDERQISDSLLSPRIRQRDEATAAEMPTLLPEAVSALERTMIYEALKRTHWNKSQAAIALGISRRNLIRKVADYKLEQRKRSPEK